MSMKIRLALFCNENQPLIKMNDTHLEVHLCLHYLMNLSDLLDPQGLAHLMIANMTGINVDILEVSMDCFRQKCITITIRSEV
jgi:hypothetical protein